MSILPPWKGLEIPRVLGGSQRPKNLSKCMKLDRNFHRGGGGGALRKNPFRREGMDNFWNHTISMHNQEKRL